MPLPQINEEALRIEILRAVEAAILFVKEQLSPGHRLGGNVVIGVSESKESVVVPDVKFVKCEMTPLENGTDSEAT